MSKLKIYTKQDKAAFLNRCKSLGMMFATTDITSGKNGLLNYFIVDVDPEKRDKIINAFQGDQNFNVELLREVIKKLIRKELGLLNK